MRILIVKLGSIGDIVHTLPSLAAIRNVMPEAQISWVVEERSSEILQGNMMIDHLIDVDTRRLRGRKIIGEILSGGGQFDALRKGRFDVAIDFQGLMKSGMFARLSGAKRRIGFSKKALREKAAAVFYTDTVDVPDGVHVIRKNLALARDALGISVPEIGFEFPIATKAEHEAEAARIIDGLCSKKFAILNPGGGWVTKLWHAEKFGELADRLWEELGLKPVLTIGPGEKKLADRAATASRTGSLTIEKPSLKGFYELAKRAQIYVGGDTGPTHLAVAAGTPVVGLFGPTEWWRNGSLSPGDICVERTDIGCRVDCHRRTCSKWICMDSDVDAVFRGIEARLSTVSDCTVGA